MKKSFLIISGAVLLGALVAALFFLLQGAHDTEQPAPTKPSVQTGQTNQNTTEDSRERWKISLDTPSATNATSNATTVAQQETKDIAPAQHSGEEDRYVSLDFLDDLITLALKHYHPAHSIANAGPDARFTLNAKILNMHYGLSLTGLDYPQQNTNRARQAILSYVLTPRTISFLFNLYGKECIVRAEEKTGTILKKYPGKDGEEIERVLSAHQQKEFFLLSAKKLRDLGKIISRIAEVPHFSKKIATYHLLRKELNSAYYTFWGLDQNSTSKEDIDTSADNIKKAILVFDTNKKNLISSIVNQIHPVMTSDTEVLYIAQWISRRITNQAVTMETVKTLGDEIQKLADAFVEHAETMK